MIDMTIYVVVRVQGVRAFTSADGAVQFILSLAGENVVVHATELVGAEARWVDLEAELAATKECLELTAQKRVEAEQRVAELEHAVLEWKDLAGRGS